MFKQLSAYEGTDHGIEKVQMPMLGETITRRPMGARDYQ